MSNPLVSIVMVSDRDLDIMNEAGKALELFYRCLLESQLQQLPSESPARRMLESLPHRSSAPATKPSPRNSWLTKRSSIKVSRKNPRSCRNRARSKFHDWFHKKKAQPA